MTGFPAWITWLVIHIYYLSNFRNRLLVLLQWAWSYVTFGRGARLIVPREWMAANPEAQAQPEGVPIGAIDSPPQQK